MNRIRSDKVLNIRVRPGSEGFITLDEVGIIAHKGKPFTPKLFVAFPK
jgi:hypothetical protein